MPSKGFEIVSKLNHNRDAGLSNYGSDFDNSVFTKFYEADLKANRYIPDAKENEVFYFTPNNAAGGGNIFYSVDQYNYWGLEDKPNG